MSVCVWALINPGTIKVLKGGPSEPFFFFMPFFSIFSMLKILPVVSSAVRLPFTIKAGMEAEDFAEVSM